MTTEAAAEADISIQQKRPELLGIAYLATISIVMLGWIAGLVWGAITVLNWLVS